MFRGGIADKLGNRYEAKWLVRQLLEVLRGKHAWLCFEGLAPEYEGFEFAVQSNAGIEWHQTKKVSQNGRWTIKALEREGVLAAFRNRLSKSANDRCFFISEDPTKDARVLADKAHIANNVGEFEANLSKEQTKPFTDLCAYWNIDKEIGWQWLQRSFFQVESTSELDSHIDIISQLMFQNSDGKRVFETLRDYLERHFNDHVSTKMLRHEIASSQNLVLKDWALSPTLLQDLKQETDFYLATYSPFGAGGEAIVRKEAQQVFEAVMDTGTPHVTLITGIAGSGKSGVVRGLIGYLRDKGVPHLALRVDYHLECKRPEDFGNSILKRRESPVVTLKGISPTEPSVLIIDQVDAVSEVSGRNGVVKSAILRMLEGLCSLHTVQVVLVCRNHDFNNDPRLKELRDTQRENRFDIPLLDWETDITPILTNIGYELNLFTSAQKELLRLPLNLAVYLEVAEEKLTFASRDDLFRALVQKKERKLRIDRNVSWSLMSVMESLAEWMSDRQRLEAPEGVLDQFPGAQDILSSEGLIVVNRNHVNFFHESFFDFTYARAFTKGSMSILELLMSSEQHLFRRTQCRQILEVMREGDKPRYLTSLETVLLDDNVRFHIKLAIAQWLGNLPNPSAGEHQIALMLDTKNGPITVLAERALFGSAGWFDLHVACGWLQQLMGDRNEQRRNVAFRFIQTITSDRPSEVAKLLRDWWDNDPEKTQILFNHISFFRRPEPNTDLEQLCVDVIRAKPKSLFSKVNTNSREMVLLTWVGENAHPSPAFLKAFFDAWFEMNPNDHPFHHENIRILDLYSMNSLRKRNPCVYIEGTIDAFIKSLRIINEKRERGETDFTFTTLTCSEYLSGDDEFLDQFRTALREVAKIDPGKVTEYLEQIPPEIHLVALHVHLDAILGNPEFLAPNFINLLSEESLFKAGWQDAEWQSFADAAAGTFPFLDEEQRAQVEQVIFSQNSEYHRAVEIIETIKTEGEKPPYYSHEHVIHLLTQAGFEQWCVLKAIDPQFHSPEARQWFEMLGRKFSNSKPKKLRYSGVYTVGSPIKHDHATKMSDAQWLKAMSKYDKRKDFSHGPDSGGPNELGQVLRECTKADPKRFVALMSRIPEKTNMVYLSNILSALIDLKEPDNEVLCEAIRIAYNRENEPHAENIIRILSEHPQLAKDQQVFDILLEYAEFGDAIEDQEAEQPEIDRETISINELIYPGDTIRIHGTNGSRGQATEALGKALWNVPERIERIRSLIECRVDTEPLVSIRCLLMAPLTPLYNHDRQGCGILVERLVSAYSRENSSLPSPSANELSPLMTHEGVNLMTHLLDGAPESAKRMLGRMKESEDQNIRFVAAFHVFRASFFYSEFIEEADALLELGKQYRQLAAEITSIMFSATEHRKRALKLLMVFFNDEDEKVRKKATSAFSHADPAETETANVLINAYLNSLSFDGVNHFFFRFLKNVEMPIIEYLIRAAENLMSKRPRDANEHWAYEGFQKLYELLETEYDASEHDATLRCRLLNIIDHCLEQKIYGADRIVSTHDRAS